MKKFLFLQLIILGFLGSGIFFSCSRQHMNEHPNIIFLLADDHRRDALGCMGNSIIQTPNLDKLASEGVIFNRAYVTSSICCASRASIFAGQYASRTGIFDFSKEFSDQNWEKTYPVILKGKGYYIGFIGKFGVGRKLPSDDFDYWKGIAGQPQYIQETETGEELHLTNIIGKQCIEFLKTRDQTKPFCLSVSFKAPHVQDNDPRQFIYDKGFEDLYKDTMIPVPETGSDEYWMNFSEDFREDNEARNRWHIRFSNPEKYQEMVKGYYRLVTGLDKVVGNIVEQLEKTGLDKNTIIIYMGDNGFFLGEHGMAGKWYGHEESIGVPLIIYDPFLSESKKGMNIDKLALNIDIAPTILEYAGIIPPDEMQGRNLSRLINGNEKNWRKDFYYENRFGYKGHIKVTEGVVSENYKYLIYPELPDKFKELYNLNHDPKEKYNLAGENDSVINKFSERLKILRMEVK